MKLCKTCNQAKSISEFYNSNTKVSECKECHRARLRANSKQRYEKEKRYKYVLEQFKIHFPTDFQRFFNEYQE